MGKGSVPGSKDVNVSGRIEMPVKHASTVGSPMKPQIGPPLPAHETPIVGRENVSRTVAITTDTRTELQSVPASVYPGPHSRDGHEDVAAAERGTGHSL